MANRGDNNAAQIAAQNAAKEHADYLVKLRTEFGQVDQSLTATNKLLQTGKHGRVLPSFVAYSTFQIHSYSFMRQA